jgi:hypothetical protein
MANHSPTPVTPTPTPPLAVFSKGSIAAIGVGILLILVAIGIAKSNLNLPYTRLLMYSGVAALFAGIGATAAITLNLTAVGQVGTAGGAAAIAILMCSVIGVDPPVRLTTTYYINMSELGINNMPPDLKATLQVLAPDQTTLGTPRDLPITRAPGGNALKLTIENVSSVDSIIITLLSNKDNKKWASSSIHPNEGFMSLNAQP